MRRTSKPGSSRRRPRQATEHQARAEQRATSVTATWATTSDERRRGRAASPVGVVAIGGRAIEARVASERGQDAEPRCPVASRAPA